MNIDFFQIDSFSSELFKGNPAGVCPLTEWLPKDILQKIAFENNLSETAFYIKKKNCFQIRFFSPTSEVDLCGHATLAAAFVEFFINKNISPILNFESKGGLLKVSKQAELITLDFPKIDIQKISLTEELNTLFSTKPIETFIADNHIVLVFKNSKDIENLVIDFTKINKLKYDGVCITSTSKKYDFISRFFAPKIGINEDPVTGFAHTFLTPLWALKLNKKKLIAKQVSLRGGELSCEINNDRVLISGTATLFLKGTIII